MCVMNQAPASSTVYNGPALGREQDCEVGKALLFRALTSPAAEAGRFAVNEAGDCRKRNDGLLVMAGEC